MADNGFMDITSGIKTGMDYAYKKAELETQQQQIQARLEEQTQQKNAVNLAKVGKIMEGVDSITTEQRPGVKRALVAKLEQEAKMFGIQIDPALKAALTDEVYGQEFAQFSQNFFQLDDKDKLKMAPEVFKQLGTSEGLKLLAETNKNLAEYNRAKLSESGKAADRKTKEKEMGLDQEKDLRSSVTQIYEKRAKDLAALDTIKKLGVADAKNPASQYEIVKAFNQFNDSAAVREGDFKTISELSGLFNAAKNIENKVKKGDPIPQNLVKNILATTQHMQEVLESDQREALSPYATRAQSSGLDLNTVFTPRQRQILGLGEAAAPKKDEKPAAGGSGAGAGSTGGGAPAPSGATAKAPAPPPNPLARFNESQLGALQRLAAKKVGAKVIAKQTGLTLTPAEIKALGIKE